MIRVTIQRNKHDRSIGGYEVTGHAGFDERGRDIVCAGVSAVTVGTVNAAEEVAGVQLDVVMREDGYLRVQVPEGLDAERQQRVQLQLESMVVMLESIRQSYGAYIAMKDILR